MITATFIVYHIKNMNTLINKVEKSEVVMPILSLLLKITIIVYRCVPHV